MDGLMETALSTAGVPNDHGDPVISEFFVGEHGGREVSLWVDVE